VRVAPQLNWLGHRPGPQRRVLPNGAAKTSDVVVAKLFFATSPRVSSGNGLAIHATRGDKASGFIEPVPEITA
jgi:hypothetical protein